MAYRSQVIKVWKLYPNPKKKDQTAAKRARSRRKPKHKLVELNKLKRYQKRAGYIICLDTITIYWHGLKRYIFTGIDKYGKAAFARMYKTKSSTNAEDFLYRLYYLMGGFLKVGRDNGTEFEKHFKQACHRLNIQMYYSRVRTPKDNPDIERFNQTLQREFIDPGNFNSEPIIFNKNLTEWLIEYNFYRPHQALNYKTPIQPAKVLPRYPANTIA